MQPKLYDGTGYKDGEEAGEMSSPVASLPEIVSQAESVARNRALWEQPGGSPPELCE